MRALLLLPLLAVAAQAMPVLWEPPYINGIAAQVADSIITYDDIRRELVPFASALQTEVSSKEEFTKRMEERAQTILDSMIERLLLIEDFKDKKFMIPDFRVEQEYRRVLNESFDGKLAEMVTALQSQGKTLEEFREDIKDNMRAQAMQGRFRSSLPEITPEQVNAYYQAHQNDFASKATLHLKAITLKPITDEPTEVLTQTADQILQRLDDGESFDELANEFNQSSSADWGELTLNDLPPALRDAVADLPEGNLSKPIVTQNNEVLLIKVEQRTNSEVPALSEVRDTIESRLRRENSIGAYHDWIAQLKEKYYVKVNI